MSVRFKVETPNSACGKNGAGDTFNIQQRGNWKSAERAGPTGSGHNEYAASSPEPWNLHGKHSSEQSRFSFCPTICRASTGVTCLCSSVLSWLSPEARRCRVSVAISSPLIIRVPWLERVTLSNQVSSEIIDHVSENFGIKTQEGCWEKEKKKYNGGDYLAAASTPLRTTVHTT